MTAFDAFSSGEALTGSSMEWTHTPAGVPQGVLCYFLTNVSTSSQSVTTAFYNGASMERVIDRSQSAAGQVSTWWVSGTQSTAAGTIGIHVTSTSFIMNVVGISVTSSTTPIVEASTGFIAFSTGPFGGSFNTTLPAFVSGAMRLNSNTAADLTPTAGFTELVDYVGGDAVNVVRRTANSTGGSVSVTWDSTAVEKAAAGTFVALVDDPGSASASTATKYVISGRLRLRAIKRAFN